MVCGRLSLSPASTWNQYHPSVEQQKGKGKCDIDHTYLRFSQPPPIITSQQVRLSDHRPLMSSRVVPQALLVP